jgi:hypothetical protein
MKNIHVLPTDKPSRLWTNNLKRRFELDEFPSQHPTGIAKNIYITNSEEIKANVYALINGVLCKTEIKEGKIVSRQLSGGATMDICKSEYLEVILTDNKDLINDGVQKIDNEFLEWFVKNQSCEFVEVNKMCYGALTGFSNSGYKIIIPKKEQNKQMYSEEDMREAFENGVASGKYQQEYGLKGSMDFNYFIEQFKNK